jgi:hypothetical protein
MRPRTWVTSSSRRSNRAPESQIRLGRLAGRFGDSLVAGVDAPAEAQVAREQIPNQPFRFSASAFENRAEQREPGDLQGRRAQSSRQGTRLSRVHARSEPRRLGAMAGRCPGRSRPSFAAPNLPFCADRLANGTEGRVAAAKAQAAQWGFNRRGVVTASSHAYIRPSLGNAIAAAGQEPQGSCFLRPASLVCALQSTR